MYGFLTTVTSLFIMMSAACQEVKFINDLNEFFNFDHNIFLLDSAVDVNQFINAGSSTVPQTIFVIPKNNNDTNSTELNTPFKLVESKNTFMIVVPEGGNVATISDLLDRMRNIQQLQTVMKIGIFFTYFPLRDEITLVKLFKWCKEQLIVDIFAAAYTDVDQGPYQVRSLNVFTYNPFGQFEVINVTGSQSYNSFFRSIDSNFQQQQLILGEQYAPDEKLWPTVLHHMNASYIVKEYNFTKWSEYFDHGVHILPKLYVQRNDEDFAMYPLHTELLSILVPESNSYSGISAYLQDVTSKEIFIFLLITILANVIVLSIVRYIKQKKISLFQNVADVLNLLVMNDNDYIKYQHLTVAEFFIVVPLTFAGFVIVNLILSIWQSFLTLPAHQPQINTIEQLYKSSFPILVNSKIPRDKIVEMFTNAAKFENWNEKINLTMDRKEYVDRIEAMDRSTSFLTLSSFAKPILKVQKRLSIKGYHDPHIHFLNTYWSSLVGKGFLFFERLNEIVHRIKSAGLYDEWCRRYSATREKRILKKSLERFSNSDKNFKSVFEFPSFIFYGWIIGTIVLVIEIIWKNLKFSSKNRRLTKTFLDIKVKS